MKEEVGLVVAARVTQDEPLLMVRCSGFGVGVEGSGVRSTVGQVVLGMGFWVQVLFRVRVRVKVGVLGKIIPAANPSPTIDPNPNPPNKFVNLYQA